MMKIQIVLVQFRLLGSTSSSSIISDTAGLLVSLLNQQAEDSWVNWLTRQKGPRKIDNCRDRRPAGLEECWSAYRLEITWHAPPVPLPGCPPGSLVGLIYSHFTDYLKEITKEKLQNLMAQNLAYFWSENISCLWIRKMSQAKIKNVSLAEFPGEILPSPLNLNVVKFNQILLSEWPLSTTPRPLPPPGLNDIYLQFPQNSRSGRTYYPSYNQIETFNCYFIPLLKDEQSLPSPHTHTVTRSHISHPTNN